MRKVSTISSPKTKNQVKNNRKISEFFKYVNEVAPAECSDIENTGNNVPISEKQNAANSIHISKKRPHSLCVSNEVETTKKTPIKDKAVLLKTTPSPSKSPSQKKAKGSKKTPVKNLFKTHPADLNRFNVAMIERFVKQSPNKLVEKLATENLVSDFKSCNLSSRSESCEHESYKNLNFDEDSWDSNSFSALDTSFTLNLTSSQHCKVLEVNDIDNRRILLLESTKTKERCWCTLSGFWKDVPVKKGTLLHVKAQLESATWMVSNDGGLVVLEPDFLISSTSVVASLFCKRRSVLTELYRSYDSENKYMVLGSIVHRLLQLCLKSGDSKISQIESNVHELVKMKDIVKMLYAASMNIDDLLEQLKQYTPQIQSFIEQYIKRTRQDLIRDNWKGKIDTIEDIEENFWCPELGVKGKVDLTVQVKDSTMPLELKTGKASMSLEHRGQVMLYVLMMQKFGYQVHSGLLLYLKDCILKEIKPSEAEMRDIVVLRNDLVYYLAKINEEIEKLFEESAKSELLPKPINHHSACKNCGYNTICCAYLKTENFNLNNYIHLKEVRDKVLEYLSEEHLKYFIHWSSLLTLEAANRRDLKNFREVFTIEAKIREESGKCISNLKITEAEECGNQCIILFVKAEDQNNKSLMTSGISENTYVVISTNTRPAAATGFVSNIDHKTISVAADRNLKTKYPNHVFHIDTYDSNNVTLFNMANLALLLEPTEQSQRLRKFIIDKQKPTFQTKLPRIVATKATPILQRLNRVQQRAVLRAVSTNDFILITGMPGTGKTSTIVALIQLLVELNQTVIITSHTHSAVDNVCLRLIKYGVKEILRLGNSSNVHKNLMEKCESEVIKDCKTPDELEKCYNRAKVVAVTCLGSGHPLLSKRTFDVCVVDESTQVLQPSVIRVLRASKKFILVGDPKQLPPVVRNTEASAKGLSESLFERLQCAESNVVLNLNYRMNREITQLANNFTYKGELLTATDEVANSHLKLPQPEVLASFTTSYPWLKTVFDESLQNSIIIINTGKTFHINSNSLNLKNDSAEVVEAQHCSNAVESILVTLLVHVLLKCGVPKEFIGVIAPYRAQVAQLSSLLQNTCVDVSTADKFQGKDKEIIILSCTKSFERAQFINRNYEVLEDDRRLNVILTRAKQKLIVIGDVECLETYKPFNRLFACLNEHCFLNISFSNEDLNSMIQLFS